MPNGDDVMHNFLCERMQKPYKNKTKQQCMSIRFICWAKSNKNCFENGHELLLLLLWLQFRGGYNGSLSSIYTWFSLALFSYITYYDDTRTWIEFRLPCIRNLSNSELFSGLLRGSSIDLKYCHSSRSLCALIYIGSCIDIYITYIFEGVSQTTNCSAIDQKLILSINGHW